MRRLDCEFEDEVLAAVMQSRWPDRTDAALREHVSACAICSDVAAVAGLIDKSRDTLRSEAVIPDSGRVWWLAQMRARREAEAAAARPITAVQVMAFACAAALLGACFGATSPWFQSLLRGMSSGLSDLHMKNLVASAMTILATHGALALGMATVLLLLPAAVYLAIGRDAN
jgi:predicted anti-sigma-YlaC factor YlaD